MGCSDRAKEKASELLRILNGLTGKEECVEALDFRGVKRGLSAQFQEINYKKLITEIDENFMLLPYFRVIGELSIKFLKSVTEWENIEIKSSFSHGFKNWTGLAGSTGSTMNQSVGRSRIFKKLDLPKTGGN